MSGFIKYLIEEMRALEHALEHGEYIVRNDAGPIVSRDHFDLRCAEIAAARSAGTRGSSSASASPSTGSRS